MSHISHVTCTLYHQSFRMCAFELHLELFTYFHAPSMCVCVCIWACVCARIWPEYQKHSCMSPRVAESRSQCSDLMRDSVSLSAVMTTSSSSSLSSACRSRSRYVGWGGCDGGIIRWGSGLDATRDDQGYVTVSTAIWVTAFNCVFRHLREKRLLSWALRRVWKRKGREEKAVKWNKSAYKIRR